MAFSDGNVTAGWWAIIAFFQQEIRNAVRQLQACPKQVSAEADIDSKN